MTRLRIVGGIAAALLFLSACSSTPPAETAEPSPTVEESPSPTEHDSDGEASGALDPVETFLAWLDASRIPEPDLACGYMSDELIDKMIDEFQTNYGTDPGGCEGLTRLTAELYETFNQSAEVSIDVASENETHAVLFVTYLESGDCSMVAMENTGSGWIMTDQTTSCDQP
ncbi:MAG TPA: hypothetical protein H9830_09400 [Candidatus Agrococcus pullicola]|uniref:Uncharacterized protein n=1 Tax=Candidatus Agrococcus pullicola TaxID=2838429 RepID=A0A9D1YWI6_9MICO|nr:hypothetical protein [Candidatus Agrococcus pullicola]